jgi:uncharacterized membrane protein YgdD (TMEM256/DUF423 family)
VSPGLLTLAGAFGFAAVALGAFGAHGLRDRLSPALLEVWRTGVLYHLVHAVTVLALALAADRLRRPRLVAGLFCAGIAIFSGTLYALALTGVTWLGAITPIGGVLLLAGWAALIVEGFSPRATPR